MQPFDAADRLEDAERLDRVAQPVAAAVQKALAPRPLRNLLHGVPIGHALHPVLVQVPIGAWLSAGVLDATSRTGTGAPVLIATGMVTAVPAAAAGLADWAEQHPQQQRVGVVHAGLNALTVGLYGASLLAPARGRRARGLAYAYAGLATVAVSGYLGGHISYRLAGGTNHAEAVPHLVAPGWHDVVALDELPEGRPVRCDLDGVPLFLLRRGAAVTALYDRCAHLDGPLHEGELVQDDAGRDCVQCPWHGSVFRLGDGSVFRGPSTSPQPVFDVQVADGRVRVCLPGAG